MLQAMDNINWQDCIADLNRGGMSYAAIAEAIGSKVSTIGDLAVGRSKQPRGMTAVRLLTLHQDAARKAARRTNRKGERNGA